MTFLLLLLPLLTAAISNLPPEPVPHLTPPLLISHHNENRLPAETPTRKPRNESSTASNEQKPPESEPQHQEARAVLWAAPAIPILTSHRGRSSDNCNPCERVPWVPMARALNTQQYALSIPTIQLTLPVNYGIPIAQMRPPQQYGPPQQQPGPSTSHHGPPPPQYGPPQQQPGPSSGHHRPPLPQYGPPPQQLGPSTPHHGPPPPQYGPPQQQPGPSTAHHGPPPPQYGPPPQHPGSSTAHHGPPQPQYGPPSQQPGPSTGHYGPPPPQYGPPSQQPGLSTAHHGPPTPQQYGSPSSQYGASPASLATGDARGNTPPHDDDNTGLPPPPLPQRFITNQKTYGPPQPQSQFTSSSNFNPTSQKYLSPPSLPNRQLLPGDKFGPPSDVNNPNYNPSSTLKPRPNYLPANPPPPHGAKPINHGPQQYQEESIKRPVFIHNPIPFPTVSKTQLPPLFNYQTFNFAQQDQLHSYLQPPKPQNVVFTITETDDSCKKCLEQSKVTDSESAQAEHVTANVIKTTENYNNPVDVQNSNVQVVKSVPLTEYLASVEYPMQIIQAPILDVPDLTKYFDLSYNNFPQVHYQQGSNGQDQKPSQTIVQPNQQSAVYVNHGLQSSNLTSHDHTSTTPIVSIDISDGQTVSTNGLPHNHKPNIDFSTENLETTEKGITSSSFSQTPAFLTSTTTRPSQIFHISKVRPHSQLPRQTTVGIPSSLSYSTTTGHYVTTKPVTEGKLGLQPPSTNNPTPFKDNIHSPSKEHQTTGLNPSGPSNLRLQDPPPPGSGAISDWTLHPYGRGWGSTPPQPFVMPTDSSYRARFAVRPTSTPTKKAKHIHQIIVPYTTNKHTPVAVQEPANNIGWTPLPPTNQGRKVPTNFNVGEQYSSTTGLDQVYQYQNTFPTGDSSISSNVPLSATGSDNLESHHILPVNNDQPLNLPPQVINQILHLNHQQGAPWPSEPEGLQQLLATNLQGLLRGEEDSIDFARLQKNIDNWTAEGYKQNSPSVNFIPVTTIPHIFNSKKIPDEYLTSTEPTVPSNSSNREMYENYQHNEDADHEGAASQKHQIKVHPYSHSKDYEEPKEDSTDNIESLLNGWSLLDTKVATPPPSSTTTESTAEAEPTSKRAWEKIQVSISPLTNEKVYVVTPVPVTEEGDTTSLLSSRVERSYSVVTSGRTAVLQPSTSQSSQDSSPQKTE